MKKFLFGVTICMAALNAKAQKIEVVDSDGNGVPYASVLTPDAEYIGVTSLEGILADAKGAKSVTISHVAFKPKDVKLNGKDVRIVLEDADFNLEEITVQPKPFIYVQTYFRMFVYSEKDGIIYYRAGLTDNTYDPQKKTVKASTNHVAKAKYGIIKTIIGAFGSKLDKLSEIKAGKVENRLLEAKKDIGLTITDIAPGKKRISDNWGTLGYITDDKNDGQRRFSYDLRKMYLHHLEAQGMGKELAKRQERDAKKQNRTETDYCLYQIDEDGNYGPEDFVMLENLTSYDEVEDGETDHNIHGLQVFAIERAYVTKEELKQRKKAGKMKMNLSNIQQFEQQHNIPSLPASVQKAIDKLK
ncbi:MAG: hypothetical protein IKQ37_01200 [Bacteroidaceae bacterium]|nr:hypothetical protein [Bacteroidaceae bacterium]